MKTVMLELFLESSIHKTAAISFHERKGKWPKLVNNNIK
jgi:hypothetical protein